MCFSHMSDTQCVMGRGNSNHYIDFKDDYYKCLPDILNEIKISFEKYISSLNTFSCLC